MKKVCMLIWSPDFAPCCIRKLPQSLGQCYCSSGPGNVGTIAAWPPMRHKPIEDIMNIIHFQGPSLSGSITIKTCAIQHSLP